MSISRWNGASIFYVILQTHAPRAAMVTLPIVLGGASGFACAVPSDASNTTSDEAPIANLPTNGIDTKFPAVGLVNTSDGCTGTLIGPDIVATAEHCSPAWVGLSAADQKAGGKAGFVGEMSFDLTPSGKLNASDKVTYHVVGFAGRPRQRELNQNGQLLVTTLPENDLMLLKLSWGQNQPAPSSLVQPMKLLTKLDSSSVPAALQPYVVHFPVRLSEGANVRAAIVGWGCRQDGFDLAGTPPVPVCFATGDGRHSAEEALVVGPSWPGAYLLTEPMPGKYGMPGPHTSYGDSGSPLLLTGLAGKGISALPPSYFVAGVCNGGTWLSTTKYGQDYWAPTLTPQSSQWVESQILSLISDSDSDGVPDWKDNCPTVPNADQLNSNIDAEITIARQTNPAADGHLPTRQTDPYVATFRTLYPGNACEPTPVAALTSSGDVVAPSTQPCADLEAQGIQVNRRPLVLGSGQCRHVSRGAQLRLDGFVGADTVFTATSAYGNAAVAYCNCPEAASRPWEQARDTCGLRWRGCVLADNTLFPSSSVDVIGNGWSQITVSPTKPLPGDLGLVRFQQRNDVLDQFSYIPASQRLPWDLATDLPRFGLPKGTGTLAGMLWSHVQGTFSSSGNFVTASNRGNAYTPTTAGAIWREDPGPFNQLLFRGMRPVLWDSIEASNSSSGGRRWVELLGRKNGVEAVEVTPEQTRALDGKLTQNALRMLDLVEQGRATLVFSSPSSAKSLLDALVVSTNNGQVIGNLRTNGATADSNDLSDQGSYVHSGFDATKREVHSLSESNGGWALTTRQLPTSGSLRIRPSVPVTGLAKPLAAAWDAARGSLAVVDVLTTQTGRQLRVLSIAPTTGTTAVRWTSAPIAILPDTITLASSLVGELLVTMTDTKHAEAAVLVVSSDGRRAVGARLPYIVTAPPVDRGAALLFLVKGVAEDEIISLPRYGLGAHSDISAWLQGDAGRNAKAN